MKFTSVVATVLLAALVTGCEENTAVPKEGELLPPENVQALSVNGSTVSLKWDAPSAMDSTYLGFVVRYDTVKFLLPTSARTYLAAGLPEGVTDFSLYSVNRDTVSSAVALLGWAPADRFDQPFVLKEYYASDPSRDCGLNIGGPGTDPDAVPIVIGQQPPVDLYLYAGGLQGGLTIRGGQMWEASWGPSLFSTTTTSSPDLDAYLSVFPSSFSQNEVPVTDNTIYYLQAKGDDNQMHYLRLHVKVVPGLAFPNRSVEIRISLQRVAVLRYACAGAGEEECVPQHNGGA